MAVTVLEAIDIVGNFATKLPALALSQLEVVVGAIRQEMTSPGSEVQYPIAWDTPKQRAAFFASDGFGKGIPTGRTGDYQGAWVVDSIANGFALTNHSQSFATEDHPAEFKAAAISGFYRGEQWQSSIHAGRWLHIATAITDNIALLPGQLMAKVSALWNESVNK